MRPVDQYRAWALRGPFLLAHKAGVLKVRWPSQDTLLAYDPSAPLPIRMIRLAGDRAKRLLEAVGDEDFAVLELVTDDLAEYFGCSRARHLNSLIDRYGEAIASDLQQVYGLDMGLVFTGALLPDELMGRIDGLPRHSRLSEALAQDDELAEQADTGDSDDTPTVPEVRFTEWTPEAEGLATVADRLGDILSAIAGFAGAKVNVAPQPRPAGARKRLQARKEDASYDEIVADVTEAHARWAAMQDNTEEG